MDEERRRGGGWRSELSARGWNSGRLRGGGRRWHERLLQLVPMVGGSLRPTAGRKGASIARFKVEDLCAVAHGGHGYIVS